MDYISNTLQERKEMLGKIGVEKIDDLFSAIPEKVALKEPLDIPEGLSEMELLADVKGKAEKNTDPQKLTRFLGAGVYDHYIPSIIDHLISRSEFYTAYTPYQAELSQGTLQAIYEYQSMVCELTGMGIANASLLDAGSAAGEAVLMASRITRRDKILVSKAVHPDYRRVAKTYGDPQELDFVEIPAKEGVTDSSKLEAEMDSDTAAVVVQYPNFYGSIDDMKAIEKIVAEDKKVLLIVIANPIALGKLTPPSEFGADIVVGDGQVLGNGTNYGGPMLGYMAITDNRRYLRQMPGRIGGATVDVDGNRGYVLTMQTREQHIRREKATSNICSNEALNALIATIYMATMGKQGIKEVASQCLQKAHYLADKIDGLDGYEVVNKDSFFHEFWVKTPVPVAKLNEKLMEKNIIAGLDLSRFEEEEGLLVCVTEKRTKEEMDKLVSALEVINNG